LTIWVEHNGEMVTLASLAKIADLPRYLVYQRYADGARGERLIRPKDPKGGRRPRKPETEVRVVPKPLPIANDWEFATLVAQWNRLVAPWV
jgi:hypothetical protein